MPLESDTRWQEIISVALVGTARQALRIPGADGQLGQILTQLEPRSPESALLSTAATLALHQRTGSLPEQRSVDPAEPCPPNTQPVCPPIVTRFLLRMLAGEHLLVLPEWLAGLAAAGQCIPAPYLPDVLDLGRQQTRLRPAIAAVLGARGRWLAQQNSDWQYAVAIASDSDWETGSAAARILFFENLRSQTPDQARELLQASWKQDAAADRAKFLGTFRQGLSGADEPFLEAALGDRSQEVKRIAADLLASLPESRLSQRMAERLQAFVTVSSGGFEIRLPEACDSAMQQDGIELKPKSGKGERAEWLRQMIAATPLSFWLQLQPQGVTQILAMAQESEWQDLLRAGWQQAAQRQGDRVWAIALLKTFPAFTLDQLQGLLAVLPVDEQQSTLLELLQTPLESEAVWTAITVLAQQPHSWSDALSRVIVQWIVNFLPIGTRSDLWRMRELCQQIALRIGPGLLTEVSSLRDLAANTLWEETMHTFLTILQFRQEIHAAFRTQSESKSL